MQSFIEENHAYRMESMKEQAKQPWKNPIPQEVMSFWGEFALNVFQ